MTHSVVELEPANRVALEPKGFLKLALIKKIRKLAEGVEFVPKITIFWADVRIIFVRITPFCRRHGNC